ncbi:hypothetical protein DPMN_058588 [Dreissena polymorpha]|uniref:Uncharacterized protein n=1 Tax=Dreissena polymorpha TaxID=45954 RepID=A0A9D4C2F8_DREPO|nr:hypothetical protein DPMN_058588 [Dreissena polymorpha]
MTNLSRCPSSFSPDGLYSNHHLACSRVHGVVLGYVIKPSQRSSFDDRKEWLLCANRFIMHTPDVLVGRVFHVGDVEQSSETLMFKDLPSAFRPRCRSEGWILRVTCIACTWWDI